MGLNVHAIECAGPPTAAPTAINQHWTNTLTGEQWFSNGTASVANWIKQEGDTDIKVLVSANDTTSGFLDDKIVTGVGANATLPIETSQVNDGADEDLKIQFDESKVQHDNLSGFVPSEHIDWTQAGAGTIHASNYVGNTDTLVGVSGNDTTPATLIEKLQAGTGVTIVENNDGGVETLTISAIADISQDCPALQIRRTTDISPIATGYNDITFDTTDLENLPASIEHDNTNTDRVLIKEDGLYMVHYHMQTNVNSQTRIDYRVRKNDSVVLAGSESFRDDGGDSFPHGITVAAELLAGDFLSFQVQRTGGDADLEADIVLLVTKCAGAKGDQGDVGPAGGITSVNGDAGPVIVLDANDVGAVAPTRSVNTSGGLQGGGDLSADRTLSLTDTAVSPGSYTNVNLTVDQKGRITTISNGSSGAIFGSENQDAESTGLSSTTSTTYQQKLNMTTPSLPNGRYRIGWTYTWAGSSTSVNFEARVQNNNSVDLHDHRQEPQDPGTDQLHVVSGFVHRNISGVNSFDLDYRTEDSGATAYIQQARLEIWRVS